MDQTSAEKGSITSLGTLMQPVFEMLRRAKGWPMVEGFEEQGLIAARELPNGDVMGVMPLLFGAGRLTYGAGPNSTVMRQYGDEPIAVPLGYDGGFSRGWDYVDLEKAVEAMLAWNPEIEAEPSGYRRSLQKMNEVSAENA